MSRGKNTIGSSNISTTPIKLKYSASYSSTEFDSVGISVIRGINTPITSSVKVPQAKINYNLIEQLFYRSYISGTLLSSGSSYDSSLQSTAASGTLDTDVRYFPTQSNSDIVYFYIPNEVFGERISRKSFRVTSTSYDIYDDGNGNLRDAMASDVHVGNIIYSQAFAIITNTAYTCYFVDNTFDYIVEAQAIPIVPSPSPSPTPSVTPSISVSPSVSPSIGATPSVTPTPSISVTPSITTTPSVTATPSVTPTPTVTVTPTMTVTPSVTVTPSISISPTPSTTPPATVYYYIANRYDNSCNLVASSVNVKSIEPLLNNYFCGAIDGYKYEIVGPNPGATYGTTINYNVGTANCGDLTC